MQKWPLQLPPKRPVLQRSEEGIKLGQRSAMRRLERFDGLDPPSKGLLEGEGRLKDNELLNFTQIDGFLGYTFCSSIGLFLKWGRI